MTEGPLNGKIALVTGAGSPIGMGRIMAEALARAGARVAMMDVDSGWLEQSAGEIREAVGDDNVITITGDISKAEDAERIVAETIDGFGGIHILINNAGVHLESGPLRDVPQTTFWEIPTEAWDTVMAVNVRGAFLMSRAAVPHLMAQGWGRIVGVTTSLDTMIRGNNMPYGASKAAHEAFTAAMANELAGTGVTANVLVPGGATNTNFIAPSSPANRDSLIQPEVMAAPIVWLASDEANDVTGRRIIGQHWDPAQPGRAAYETASAPAAWPQLGRQPTS